MSFIMPTGARDFFKLIESRREAPKFDSMFDYYYLCLMIGLDSRLLASEDSDLESAEFVKAYPADYHAQADLVAGLLIDAELDRKGINPEDRESIEQEMLRLLDLQSATRLSDEGMRLLNRYAAEGFKLLRDRVLQPQNLEDFLVAYQSFWQEPSSAAYRTLPHELHGAQLT